jgi:hypothetical protein
MGEPDTSILGSASEQDRCAVTGMSFLGKHASVLSTFPKTKPRMSSAECFSQNFKHDRTWSVVLCLLFLCGSPSLQWHSWSPCSPSPLPRARFYFSNYCRLSLGLERNQVFSLVFKQLAILKFPGRAVGIFISVSWSVSFSFWRRNCLHNTQKQTLGSCQAILWIFCKKRNARYPCVLCALPRGSRLSIFAQ